VGTGLKRVLPQFCSKSNSEKMYGMPISMCPPNRDWRGGETNKRLN
jgi:hypothetical protein